MKLINEKKLKENYIFHHIDEKNKKEIYFCKCGAVIHKEMGDLTFTTANAEIGNKLNENPYKDVKFEDVFNNLRPSVGVSCKECGIEYDKVEVFNSIYPTNQYFIETFKFVETKNKLILYKVRTGAKYNNSMKTYKFENTKNYISVDKKTKKLYYKNEGNNEDYEFTLDKIILTVNNFFRRDNEKITDNLFDVHQFINRLANFVSDSKSFDLIEELMKEMIGKSGINILIKTISIFLGIISYSNLSTIALTKGLVFLYEMMNNCNLPNPQVLSDNEATSPLNIFNFLVNLENKNLQEEIDEENPEKQGYIFKSKKGVIHNFNYDIDRFDKNTKGKIQKNKVGVQVREDLTNKTVSKYIFKNIKNFNEYKKIIKYTKFIKYEELISLVMKYDMELLLNLFPLIEFRNDVNMERLNQFIYLTKDYAKRIQVGGNMLTPTRTIGRERLMELSGVDENKSGQIKFVDLKNKVKEEDINYSLIKTFDFTVYDDCLRMIFALNWDPNKEFYKLKDVDKLEEYHDELTKHFNMLADKDKGERFKNFVSKFRYLEEYDNDLKIRLIPTPDTLLKEAKELHNCASSYVNRISRGQYVLMTIYDLSKKDKEKDKFMMGLNVTSTGLEFDQIKSKYNRQGKNKFKKQVMTYLESKDISYRALADLKIKDDEKERDSVIDMPIFDVGHLQRFNQEL